MTQASHNIIPIVSIQMESDTHCMIYIYIYVCIFDNDYKHICIYTYIYTHQQICLLDVSDHRYTQLVLEGDRCTDGPEIKSYCRMHGTAVSELLHIVSIVCSMSHIATGTASVIDAVAWQTAG